MVNYVAFYPGQGAQYPGMAMDLYQTSAAVRQLFETASDACGRNLVSLLKEGGTEDLQLTENTQVAVTLANRSASLRLAECGITPSIHAGFSLGELSAFSAAGILDDFTLFSIVSQRGKLMAEAGESASKRIGTLGMAAVIGLGFNEVSELFASLGTEGLYCANDNGPKQVVVSGLAQELEQVSNALKEAGARRIIPLKVSGPFHTPFMGEAVGRFSQCLSGFSFTNPTSVVYSTVTGSSVLSGEEAKQLCSRQLESPVRWTSIMQAVSLALEGSSEAQVLEVGPGKVLSGLWKSAGYATPCQQAGTESDIVLVMKGEW